MRKWLKAFSQMVLRKGIMALSYLLVLIEPEQKPFTEKVETKQDKPSEPVVPQTPASEAVVNYLPVSELPMELLTSEYFVVPFQFRVYPALMEGYRNELISDIKVLVGCNEHKAELILKSMEHWLAVLQKGELSPDSDTSWLVHYANMSRALDAQTNVGLGERARIVNLLLSNTSKEDSIALQGPHKAVTTILATGELPASVSLVALDLMAFASTPKLLRKRVGIFNGKLGTKLHPQGQLSLN